MPSLRLALLLIVAFPAGLPAQAETDRDRSQPRLEAKPPFEAPSVLGARERGEKGPASDGAAMRPLSPSEESPTATAGKERTKRPLPPAGREPSHALAPPGSQATSGSRSGGLQSVSTVVGSLAVVLGLFFIVAWLLRRAAPGTFGLLPKDVLEVLGRSPLAARQQVHLIRLGSKLVLISVTPAGVEALSEITEPEEVDRLTGLCRQVQPGSATTAFRNVLDQFSGERRRTSVRSGKARVVREEETLDG
jgi:flagellar biogenesis protein FliO